MSYNFFIFLLSLTHITLALAQTSGLPCNSNDLTALNDFKGAIQNDTSHRLEKWVGNQCCQWVGITCDYATGRVTEINLPSLINTYEAVYTVEMTGFLPSSITLLSSLEVLDLGGQTGISGNIPKSIGFKLPNLRKLILNGNKLTGPIPDSILQLTKLEKLDLHSNALEGLIPENIGVLKSMTHLDLSNNRFSGKIPVSVTNLSSLTLLGLSYNKLEGPIPSSLGNLSQLKFLYASYNMIQGSLPQDLTVFHNLAEVDLSFNRLNLDTIPKWIAGSPSLETLKLAGCKINFLNALENQTGIRELDLSSNNLTGSIPSWIWNNAYIYSLNLSRNSFVSINNIRPTWGVIYLDLSYNLLQSTLPEIPESLATATYLETLMLQNNHFSGEIPPSYSNLSSLKKLDLSNNFLVGKIPTGGPFDRLPASSYSGNKALCGKPLPSCSKT